ncbi:MAG: fibronectin type III domain-containing protein [Candidatus Liptonbacteria bacterium]|nr:fibronectin type III domain-containing protein [Candidatus Liptonbacteria bacterium]
MKIGGKSFAGLSEAIEGCKVIFKGSTLANAEITETDRYWCGDIVSVSARGTPISQPKPPTVCPALPTVESCPAGQKKEVSYSSPECGEYYTCVAEKPLPTPTSTKPRVCPALPTVTSCPAGTTKVLSYSSPECGEYYRCVSDTEPVRATTTASSTWDKPPAGQKEQIWNSLGLRSWIRVDADVKRIEEVKQYCANVTSNSNVWLPKAGEYASADFGMPDLAKCKQASACKSSEYWNGSSCAAGWDSPGTTSSTWNSSSTWNTECERAGGTWEKAMGYCRMPNASSTRAMEKPSAPVELSATVAGSGVTLQWNDTGTSEAEFKVWRRVKGGEWISHDAFPSPKSMATGTVYYSDSNVTADFVDYKVQACNYGGCSAESNTVSITLAIGGGGLVCPPVVGALLGNGCHGVGDAWFDGYSVNYVIGTSTQIKNCNSTYVAGCAAVATKTYDTSQSCPPGQYWSGTSCAVSSSSSSTMSTQGGVYTPAAGQKEQVWNSAGFRSWIRADADPARIEQVRAACASTPMSANVWSSTAGNASSSDFGMPDPAKCTAAANCGSGAYFNGTGCTSYTTPTYTGGSTYTGTSSSTAGFNTQSGCAAAGGTWSGTNCSCPSGMAYNGTSCAAGTWSSGSTNYSSMQSGCATAGGTWNSASNYCQMPGSSSLSYYSGSNTYDYSSMQAGCTSAGGTWTGTYCNMPSSGNWSSGSMNSFNTESGCASAGGTWSGTYCSCPSGKWYNGTSCVTSAAPKKSFLANIGDNLDGFRQFVWNLFGR